MGRVAERKMMGTVVTWDLGIGPTSARRVLTRPHSTMGLDPEVHPAGKL